jgi:N-acetylmuramoyl-L-alanine amidase
MRQITHIVVHCTATGHNTKIENIKKYWKEVLGWKVPGYHFIIEANGNITQLHPESLPSNGVAGHNSKLINICYIGGIDAAGKPFDNRTLNQKAAMIGMLKELKTRYPNAEIVGHRDFPGVTKACPCFDAKAEYKFLSK